MERDFMGLNSKESVTKVKEETVEGCMDSVLRVPWPLSNKVPALPNFMALKSAQEDKTAKIVSDPLAASGFTAVTTADAFDPTYKRSSCESQNFSGAGLKQQFLGCIPVKARHSVLPSLGSAAGITEPWFNSKISGGPAQLTIFYAGTVNVYNDVTPEKAQAIMFLAGNGSSTTSNGQSRPQIVQIANPKLAEGDFRRVNQPLNTAPGSGLPSPMSVSSHPVVQPGSGSINNNEVMAVKTMGILTFPENKVDPPKIVTSAGSVNPSTMISSAVPQARKKSLVRFLEKRKERVMSSAPYDLCKESPECAAPDSMM